MNRYQSLCGRLLIAWIAFSTLAVSDAVAQLTLSGGLTLVQEGPSGGAVPANLATGATPFTSSDLGPQLGIAFHVAANLNDQVYGNGNSWIGGDANPFAPDAFAGIDFGSVVNDVQSIAFGRDNLGAFTDRFGGVYTLQYTQVANPSGDLGLSTTGVPGTGWTDIGTLDYGASEGPGTNYNETYLRHRFNFAPVDASGIRFLVPATGLGGGTAIDEIEVYDMPGAFVEPPPKPAPFEIMPAAGFSVTWDGNDGDHFDSAAPPLGSQAPDNLALATNGATAFTSSDLGPQLGIAFHVASNLNDGTYGNANSWISADADPDGAPAVAGVALNGSHQIGRIAFGRDNGNTETDACGGTCTDRWAGQYTLQITDAAAPSTADDSEWTTIALLDYVTGTDDGPGGDFTGYLRHEFEVASESGPLVATGVRLLVPTVGLAGGTAIDEIEVYAIPEPSGLCLLIVGILPFAIACRRRRR